MTTHQARSPITAPPHALPVRIAQCRHADLEAFNSGYFGFLNSIGCTAIYLQNAPFDPMRTGNTGQFFHHFHLISLFDIARSHRRLEYQTYINTVCQRAAEHDITVWLDCWEPRLPAYAQGLIPAHWRGRGGWGWHGKKDIAFCWEEPEAVAFWKQMATDAMAALPGLGGVIVSMIDNEASFCDASCPRCQGRSQTKGILDIFATFHELARQRPGDFRLAMYDWWLPADLADAVLDKLPAGSLVIGRSARGIPVSGPEGLWEGHIADISNVAETLATDFPAHCSKAHARDLVPIDMVSWSRGMENFFLPAPPDPLFAIRKCRALAKAGAGGWMDYDCGCIEPGAIAAGMREWTQNPEENENILLHNTLHQLWGPLAGLAAPAYELYREAREWMPCGLTSKQVANMDARGCGLGICLFGPYHLEDFSFSDGGHGRNYFAPFNLLAADTLPVLLRSIRETTDRLAKAWTLVASLQPSTESARWELAVFEIYYRSFHALSHYVELAQAKWQFEHGTISREDYRGEVARIATAEFHNLEATERWHKNHPGILGNPCHRLVGHMMEIWPDADFASGLYEPKRKSLKFLKNHFDPGEFVPSHVIQGTPIPSLCL